MNDDERSNGTKEEMESIWIIRDHIQGLEDIKGGIIDFLN